MVLTITVIIGSKTVLMKMSSEQTKIYLFEFLPINLCDLYEYKNIDVILFLI